jgi:sterol desaturase/sphingolipid hydroxylase (fatty acid hydroxylase superfamily)
VIEKIWLPVIVFASFVIFRIRLARTRTSTVNLCFFLLAWLGILPIIGKVVTLGTASRIYHIVIGLIPSKIITPTGFIGIAFYFVFLDFLGYWHHRLMHTKIFWPLHSVHHSSTSFDILAAFREHPLNTPISTITVALPVAVVFDNSMLAGIGISIYLIAVKIINILQHSESPASFGLLDMAIVSPRLHRIHHSSMPCYYDCNFSQTFVVWDILFNTYKNSEEGYLGPIGFESNQDLNSLLLVPAKQFIGNIVGLLRN